MWFLPCVSINIIVAYLNKLNSVPSYHTLKKFYTTEITYYLNGWLIKDLRP